MGFLDRFSSRPKVGGQIAYFGLTHWWLSAFSEEERRHIDHMLGIASGDVTYSSGTAASLLSAVATNFHKPGERRMARLMLKKAEELGIADRNALDLHFVYLGMIETFYRDRKEDPNALAEAIGACEKQIDLAQQATVAWKHQYPREGLPAHTGYTQLAIIRQKQGNLDEAIRLCKQARAQGWAGDWEERIVRYEKVRHKRPK